MYPLTFYVKSLPPGVGGCANGPVIRILDKYRTDRGIYQHELTHVLQWLYAGLAASLLIVAVWSQLQTFPLWWAAIGMVAHSLLYLLVPAYKLWAEVQAYREQAKWYPNDRRPLFARFIAANYGLKVDQAIVLEMLQ